MIQREVSVVIPVYQEAARVGQTIERVCGLLGDDASSELIVVDDGSTDGTFEAIERAARRHPQLHPLRLESNRGKGAAVRAGMGRASGSFTAFCDADLTIPIDELDKFLAALRSGADVAIASRTVAGASGALAQPPARRLVSRAFNAVIRRRFSLPYRDTQCGFKAFTRQAALAIFSRSRVDGFAFDVELLLITRELGLRVEEVPVRLEQAQGSTVSLARHAWPVLRDIWNLR